MTVLATGIQALEAALISRLKAEIPTVAVEAFPDDPKNYRLTHPNAALLVHYRGFQVPETAGHRDMSGSVTLRRINWDISVYTRSLRAAGAHEGAYHLLTRLGEILPGWRLPGTSGGMTPLGESFIEHEGGTWLYVARYACLSPLVPKRPPPDGAPLTHVERRISPAD
jgi:hypothetical protein